MAWADKAKAGSGGAVEGKITDYSFLPYFPFGEDDEPGDNVYMMLEITPEGADEPIQRSLYLGSGAYLVIEEDGKVLRGGEEGEVNDESIPRLYPEGEVFRFIESLEAAGFPAESRFPDIEDTKTVDFRAMIGWRIRVTNEVDAEATKKLGKRKVKKGKHKGKEFNRTWTKVVKVLGEDEGGGKASKKGTKAAKSDDTPSAKTTKGAKAKATVADDDEDEGSVSAKDADKFIVGVLNYAASEDETVNKQSLPLACSRYGTAKKIANKDDLRKFVTQEDYLVDAAERGVIAYDAKSKKKAIALPDEDDDDE